MQELHPGDQTWYLSEDGITLEQLPFIDPRTGAPSAKEDFKPETGRLSYTRSPSEARDRICRALGIGRASSPLGKKFNEVFQMGTRYHHRHGHRPRNSVYLHGLSHHVVAQLHRLFPLLPLLRLGPRL